ncbi:hypothetical protein NLU13_5485 [Sarocladium strictum]|uniref:Mannan polymerase II complex ANP1 subunit n=1 Tax=Sarocladium strictum TaxID=5046 RepID=A0AA39GGZ6_SARSR|nr:hypothetical protein NLU13_5485 [Sarocladium strictum]
MMLPGGGSSWKSSSKGRIPPVRVIRSYLTRTRILQIVGIVGILTLLWRSMSGSYDTRFYCSGPAKAPMDMTKNDHARWHAHMQTPVMFNHHEPIKVDSKSISHIDLNPIVSTRDALVKEQRILILTPLKDAAPYISRYFDLLTQLTYPHRLIDVAFLVSDSRDDTLAVLATELDRIQKRTDGTAFNSATIVEKDFNFFLSQDVDDRHAAEAQGPRRKFLGKARNYLLATALKPEHSWVYWRDVDIVENPPTLLEDFIAHDKDILVPNIWFHRMVDGKDIQGRYDYNSWIESDQGRRLAASLDKDVVIAEGYPKFKTGREYMCLMGDLANNKDEEIELDGIGGVSILVKADVHRSGINFPAYAFENQAETEGFAKMAKRAGYQVIGLPNYVVWHIDTDEKHRNN